MDYAINHEQQSKVFNVSLGFRLYVKKTLKDIRVSKLLIIGTGPLYDDRVCCFNGQGLRTWQFVMALRNAGHEVELILLPTEGHARPNVLTSEIVLSSVHGNFPYTLINSTSLPEYLPYLQRIVDSSHPEALVAVNHNAAWPVVQLDTDLPIWADLNGYIMGEAQTKSMVFDNDVYLGHFWSRERRILRRADKFSAVSRRQMYATIGELGALGRLNSANAMHGFVSTIPNAMAPEFLNPPPHRRGQFRGTVFPRDAYVVLWSGGFNTWTNVQMLADALSHAMMREPSIHFVATGGAIVGHDEKTYQFFLDEMSERGLAERYTMLGWIEGERIFDLYRDCNLGLCVDGKNYETLMGARNRITNMVAMRLPVLTTFGTEISEELAAIGAVLTTDINDAQEMANAIVYASRNIGETLEMAAKAARYANEKWTPDAATQSILDWARRPYRAPDNMKKMTILQKVNHAALARNPMAKILVNPADAVLSGLEEEARICERECVEDLLADSRDLHLLRNKPLFRIWRSIKKKIFCGMQKLRKSE